MERESPPFGKLNIEFGKLRVENISRFPIENPDLKFYERRNCEILTEWELRFMRPQISSKEQPHLRLL